MLANCQKALTFDWDTLEVIEGAADIQNAIDMCKKLNTEEQLPQLQLEGASKAN